jgi:hypothetical protein
MDVGSLKVVELKTELAKRDVTDVKGKRKAELV